MGEIELTVSASGIKSCGRCMRLAIAQHVLRLRSPGTPSTDRGKALHKLQEGWLRDGVHPRDAVCDHPQAELLVDLACKGIPYLPPPKSCAVEHEWLLPLCDGINMRGYTDVWDRASRVWDHKSTSNIAKWALTARGLPKDEQAIIYAHQALSSGGASPIMLRWIYYQTSGAHRVVSVEASVSREYIAAAIEPIEKTAQKMLDVKRKYGVDWLAIDADVGGEACYAYNGCHLLPYCLQAREDPMSETLDRLRAEASAEFGPKPEGKPGVLDAPRLPASMPWDPPTPVQAPSSVPVIKAPVETPIPIGMSKKDAVVLQSSVVAPEHSKGVLILLIDCLPIKSDKQAIILSTWLQPYCDRVARDNKKVHWSLCDFGHSAGELAAACRADCETLTGAVYADSSDASCRAVLPHLIAIADTVIKGTR